MPRFFTDNISENKAVITGEDALHISKSLRMKCGEEITLCSEKKDYNGVIKMITPDSVEIDILSSEPCKAEPSTFVTLFQAMPKGSKLDSIIQKSVELGVSEIIPVLTERCVSRPTEKEFAKKLPRYNKIALEAAKQCQRGYIPKVLPMVSFETALKMMKNDDNAFILYENGGKPISKKLTDFPSLSFMIGSEGGFSEKEIKKAESMDINTVWLGNRILRCETAPAAVLAIIMFLTENL